MPTGLHPVFRRYGLIWETTKITGQWNVGDLLSFGCGSYFKEHKVSIFLNSVPSNGLLFFGRAFFSKLHLMQRLKSSYL